MNMFCCQEPPAPSVAFCFNPLKDPFIVNVDLGMMCYDSQLDFLCLVPRHFPLPRTLPDLNGLPSLRLESEHSQENLIAGFLEAKIIPQDIYRLCYFRRGKSSCCVNCLGESKPFPYCKLPESAIWVQRNSPFRLPSPCASHGRKNGSELSHSTCSDSALGSFLHQRKLSSSPKEKDEVAEEAKVQIEIHNLTVNNDFYPSKGKSENVLQRAAKVQKRVRRLFVINEDILSVEELQELTRRERQSENVASSATQREGTE